MTSNTAPRPSSPLARHLAFGLALAVAGGRATPAHAELPAPTQHFTLDDTYADRLGGTALIPHGGNFWGGGYRFEPGQGLSLTGLPAGVYTLDFEIHFDPRPIGGSAWGKLVDFQDRTRESGLHRIGAHLGFWDPAYLPAGAALPDSTLLRLTVTRDASSSFSVYANGALQLNFADHTGRARFDADEGIGWFLIDNTGGNEVVGGWLGELRVWDRALSAAQVAELGAPTAPVPEPATWALWLAGLGVAGLRLGRRARGARQRG
jgi:hypothetical protein